MRERLTPEEAAGWQDLYEAEAGNLHRLARSVSQSPDDAGEAVQEAFARLMRNLDPRTVSKFALPNKVREIASSTRRSRRRQEIGRQEMDRILRSHLPGFDRQPTGGIDAVAQVEWLISNAGLTGQQARVVRLIVIEGQSTGMVAALLGISKQAVNGHFLKAKKQIAILLKQGDD